jgi:phosphate:Na+ symporter
MSKKLKILMSGGGTGYSIQKKLVEVATILFINNNLLKEIGEQKHETK